MRKFILGVIVTLLVLILGGLGMAMLGFFPTAANVEPPHFEGHLMMGSVDASMERHAPRVTSPLTPTDQNLEDGMKLYTMNCALCHGGLDRKPSPLATSFYPPPPNLISDPPDDPSGTSSTPSAPASATPACPPGTKPSASPTCGKLRCCSPTSTNSRPMSRNTGRQASTSPPPPKMKRKTKRKRERRGMTITETVDECRELCKTGIREGELRSQSRGRAAL